MSFRNCVVGRQIYRWRNGSRTARQDRYLYFSVLTLGEIRKGIEMLSDGPRRLVLRDWLDIDLPRFFTGRILAIDLAVADRWGRIVAAAGRSVPAVDSLLAATAATHDLILVTRNIKDFIGFPVTAINPWQSDAAE